MEDKQQQNHMIFLAIICIASGLLLILYPFFNLPASLFSCIVLIIFGFCFLLLGIYIIKITIKLNNTKDNKQNGKE